MHIIFDSLKGKLYLKFLRKYDSEKISGKEKNVFEEVWVYIFVVEMTVFLSA